MRFKNLLIFVLTCLIGPLMAQDNSTSTIQLISETENSIKLSFQLDGFLSKTVQTEQGEAFIIDIEEGTPILKAGAPDLPKLTASVVIGDQKNTAVRVVSSVYQDYPNIKVAPSKGNLYRNVDPSTIAFEFSGIFDQDEFFPNKLVDLRDPYIFRDFRGQTVITYPVQYNPVTETLRVYSEIIIEIINQGGESINAFNRTVERPHVGEQFESLYGRRFVNYGQQSQRYDQVSELGNMLIITDEEYLDALTPFVDWKLQKGIKTDIVLRSDIGETAEEIQNFVADFYSENGLTYLLLIGDESQVPSPFVSNGGGDGFCDNCYGYISGDDHYPEIFVGRFPSHDLEELQPMLDKTMEYEIYPDTTQGDWFSTALGAGSAEGPGDDNEYDYEHLNNIKSDLLGYTYQKVFEFYDGSQADISPTPEDSITVDLPDNPTTSSISARVNSGISLYNYVGHGDHAILVTGGFNNNAINNLTNTGKYPFLIAVACCVGDFDETYGNGDCLGERWLKATDNETGAPTGGIGGTFSSVLQSWAPPMEGQDEMNKLITELAVYNIRHTLGGILVHGGGSMMDNYGNGGNEMMDTWNMFGDPSVELRTAFPQGILASHVESVFIGTDAIIINSNVENALVGLYYQNDYLGSGLIENGIVNIPIEGVTLPGEITVTVSAFNHIPYQGLIQVTPAEGAFVILNDYQLIDTDGNNNSEADFQETIQLDVNLANVGLEVAPGVVATLSTIDPSITILNNEATWGDLEDSTNMTMIAAYEFEVSDAIEDGHFVDFLLEINSDTNQWTGHIFVDVLAPELAVGDLTLDDSQSGNGNGRLDGGELVTLMIPSGNDGHSNSQDAIGTLSTTSPYLSIVGENGINLGSIEWNGNEAMANFTIEVSSDAPTGEMAELTYEVVAGNYSAQSNYTLAINLIVEDFESNSFESYPWSNEGNAPWFVSINNPINGAYCSESGNINNNQDSELSLEIDVLEAGTIGFYRKTSSEADWDYLHFYIDDEELAKWSGEKAWELAEFAIDTGEHKISWTYIKDGYVSDGQDAAWIDDVILPVHQLIDTVTTSIVDVIENIKFSVAPNPAFAHTVIHLDLLETTPIEISVLNAQGERLDQIVNKQLIGARHDIKIDMERYPSGMYFVVLRTGDQTLVRKLVKA